MIVTLKALANERRMQILKWLKNPEANFPPQIAGDLVEDGVCGVFIAEKLGVSQPTVIEHLKVLSQAGLVRPGRIK
jgi:ArsR family transcriptional regulator